ncbi:helix-turn-helix domain-containing protein [Desulfoscipio sp. XC116]|uniref:helix-turn-helix domain-containing protein n=1 Tax=Desulfoscipio sp. XC116 TaxID=3144975 RepID=UPI00325C1F71
MADWITEEELCEWLKIKRMTAYRWRKAGMPHIGSRKSIRYNKEEVEQWLKEKAVK